MKLIFGYLDLIHALPSRVYLPSAITKQSQLSANTADSARCALVLVYATAGTRGRVEYGDGEVHARNHVPQWCESLRSTFQRPGAPCDHVSCSDIVARYTRQPSSRARIGSRPRTRVCEGCVSGLPGGQDRRLAGNL